MVCWTVLLALSVVVMVPPRQLTVGDVLYLLFIPLGAFVAYLPSVPLRWFGFYGGLCAVLMELSQSNHMAGTLRAWGWAGDFRAILLPAFIFIAGVYSSVGAAWLRQLLHRAIANPPTPSPPR